jgi:hypothetical protein
LDIDNTQKLQTDLALLMSEYKDAPIAGVIIGNSKGVVVANYNWSGIDDIGKDVSDRDYYVWSKDASYGDFFYGNPVNSRIGASSGQQIITLTTPLYTKNKYSGFVTFAINGDGFSRRYLEPIKFTDTTAVFLVDSNGKVFYSDNKQLVGINIIEDMGYGPEGLIKEVLASGKENKFSMSMPLGGAEVRQLLVSTYPVTIKGKPQSYLMIATPSDHTNLFVAPIYDNQVHALVVFVLISIGFAIIEITTVAITSKKSYEKGYRKGREQRS